MTRSCARRLRVPLLLVLLPLLPLVLLAVVVACLVGRINPFRAVRVGWRLLWALGGTRIEVEQGSTAVLVKLG